MSINGARTDNIHNLQHTTLNLKNAGNIQNSTLRIYATVQNTLYRH